MIIEVGKYLFIGAKNDLNRFFLKAQAKGFFEFISPSQKKAPALPAHVKNLIDVIKLLRKQPVLKQVGNHNKTVGLQLSDKVLHLRDDIQKLEEEKRITQIEISRIEVFGDFSLDDIAYIEKEGRKKVQFFFMKSTKAATFVPPPEMISVGSAYDMDYFVAVNDLPKSYPGMVEIFIPHSLGSLKTRLEQITSQLKEKESELKKCAAYIQFLKEVLLEELNAFYLGSSKQKADFPIENAVFAVEAWVPKNKEDALFEMMDEMMIHVESIPVEKEDRVPTYMENEHVNKIGEDLIKVYDVPSTEDKDPSGWVLWSFLIFFAIITADAGYGLLYLVLGLFLKFKFREVKGFSRRFINLVLLLATSCVIWGVMSSSYFGMSVSREAFLSKFSLLHYLAEKKADYHLKMHDEVYQDLVEQHPALESAVTTDQFLANTTDKSGKDVGTVALDQFTDSILLELSLFLGVVHLALSMIRNVKNNWAGIGWVIFMIGGYLYAPYKLNATSFVQFMGILERSKAIAIGGQLALVGIGIALALALIQRKSKGLMEIMNLVTVFSDVLSYLRLYALALASAIMARTFNKLGIDIGLLIGIFVILMGHGINLLLSVMSGVIHGLRLNFIEWYHFSYTGGGKLFNPLRKVTKSSE